MPIHIHKIVYGDDPDDPNDYFAFERLEGSLQPRSQVPEIIDRPGKNDTTIRLTGIKGRPVTLTSLLFPEDLETAANLLVDYTSLKDGAAYNVWQNSVDFGWFRVLDVVEVAARACTSVAGNTLVNNPTAMQVCQWTLQHVPEP